MIDKILKSLYEHGPQKTEQLAETIGADNFEVCEAVATLIISRTVHFDTDGTVWYAKEIDYGGMTDDYHRG